MRLWTKRLVWSIVMVVIALVHCSKKVTQPPEPLPVYPIVDNAPAWSPDGQTIAYWHSGIIRVYEGGRADAYPDSAGIWFINLQTKERRLFIQSGNMPDWSPDGEWLVFSNTANQQIYKIKITGDNLTQLTFEGKNFSPTWSPEGDKIAWELASGDSCGVWIMDDSGVDKKLVVKYGSFPDWLPLIGKERIAYRNWGKGATPNNVFYEIWLTDTSGQYREELTNLKEDVRSPAFSPDGAKIAFSYQADGHPPQICLLLLESRTISQLTTEGGISPAWSPDGKKIVYCRYDSRVFSNKNGCLWIINDVDNPDDQTQLTFWGK